MSYCWLFFDDDFLALISSQSLFFSVGHYSLNQHEHIHSIMDSDNFLFPTGTNQSIRPVR